MASHRDTDSIHHPDLAEAIEQMAEGERPGNVYQRLQQRGTEMLERRLSTIAAGDETDTVLFEKETDKLSIRQLAVDPDCLRISIGEVNSEKREKYITFRGDPRRVRKVLQRMVREIDTIIREGQV